VAVEPDASADATVLDLKGFSERLTELRAAYQSATPFPHIVLDDFLRPEIAEMAIKEFPPLDPKEWNTYSHTNERKFSHTEPATWGPNLQAVLEELISPRFVQFLSELTGFSDLFVDDSLEGGGLHQSTTGGFLNIHADFTVHPHHRDWRRRVNFLLYLNVDWKAEYGGDLELWSTDMKGCAVKVPPVGNRAVVFTTDVDSFHGHPEPMQCPRGMGRQSLALYYFTLEHDPIVRSTEYRARPGDGYRSILIYADKQVLRAYDWTKRHLGVSDETADKFLRRIERLRRKNDHN